MTNQPFKFAWLIRVRFVEGLVRLVGVVIAAVIDAASWLVRAVRRMKLATD